MGRWERLREHLTAFIELWIALATAVSASILTLTSVLGLPGGKIAQALLPPTLVFLALALLRDRFGDRATAASVATLQDTVTGEAAALRVTVEDNTKTLGQVIRDNTAAVHSLTHNQLFATDYEPYRQLVDHIDREGAREVILFQYSGKNSMNVMTAAMRQGATIELFIEQEDTAARIGSQKQHDRIPQTMEQDMSARHKDYPDAVLKISKAFAPMSVRAIRIDDKVLCVGWYTFEEIDRVGDAYPDDKITISGHDRPTLIAWAGTPEYDVINEMLTNMLAVYRKSATPVHL